ncbi:hypothetical protein FSP39_020093 [Pinctada imbricata]|uniref:B box-type domain-containing protein n=1 Tax=Pinctada imbricata TaxID=66713 RepID=A0AA89C9D0_PINIB|nr:hypothetical protein FSP39_020093 [Pinctada imbricata]
MCREHDDLFTFYCRTCDENICSKCLSAKHKKHDFVDLRELQLEVQKQLDDVIKEKEAEKQNMIKSFDDLVQHERQSEMHFRDECAKIKDRVEAIKFAADDEGGKLMESLNSTKHQQDKEVKEGKHKIQTQTRVYDKEIQMIQQELRLQTASSSNDFVKESMKKLKALKPTSISIPDKQQLPLEEQVDGNQIRETIGKLLGAKKVSGIQISRGREGKKWNVLAKLDIIRILNLDKIGYCCSLCLIPDGSIWIGGDRCVYKMSSDCSTVLHQIPARKHYWCGYIACLQSGDAVVTYGGTPYVDRFTSNGRRVEFTYLPLKKTHDMAINSNDEVVISVNTGCIIIFSNKGTQLKEIEVDGGIKTFCTDRDGHIIVADPRSPNLTILDGMSGEVKTSWKVSVSDIEHLMCDRYGNVLVTNKEKNVYFFNKDGDVQKTFTMDCNIIIGICVNKEDHLLILMYKNYTHEIHVTKYLE